MRNRVRRAVQPGIACVATHLRCCHPSVVAGPHGPLERHHEFPARHCRPRSRRRGHRRRRRLPPPAPAGVGRADRHRARRLLAARRQCRRHRDRRVDRGVDRGAAAAAAAAPAVHHQTAAGLLHQDPSDAVGDRAGCAGSRHGRLRGRVVFRQARLADAARPAQADVDRAGAGVPRWPGRGAVPDDQRLGDHPRPRRSATGAVGLHQTQQVLRHDRAQAVRRTRLQCARQPQGDPEAFLDLHRGQLHRRQAGEQGL